MKTVLKAGIFAAALCGWWGLLYPELTLTQDTYRIVYELGKQEEAYANLLTQEQIASIEYLEEDGAEQYYEIMAASSEQIKIRSKILTEIQAILNKNSKDKE